MKTYRKGADEALRVPVDWRLDVGETIETATYTVPAGLTEGSSRICGKTTEVVISGGTLGSTYTVEAEITTDLGSVDQTLEKSFKVMVVDK